MIVTDADLADLHDRLARTRWPQPWPGTGWEAGTEQAELRRLADRWQNGYDWRAHEREIEALPAHVVEIDGIAVHYLRFDAESAGALPIVITNGWPSTFYELVDLARRLSSPARFGGSDADAFTVIVPSLPGFGWSPQRQSIADALPTHEIWHRLMHDVLGFDRYAAEGGDLGSGVTSRLAEAHPEAVVGIHLMSVASPVDLDESTLTIDERAYRDAVATWMADEGAYNHEQSTKPATLSYGLSDSPVGLLAWIIEKYRSWGDTHGELSSRFSDDFLLTQASIYWFTNSISTSFRPYFENGSRLAPPVRRVTVPTAVALFPADMMQPPRSWAERTYDVRRFTRMPRGGHFAPIEETALLADDVTEFFRDLR